MADRQGLARARARLPLVAFSNRKTAAYLLDAGYQLVYMVVMGLILASQP